MTDKGEHPVVNDPELVNTLSEKKIDNHVDKDPELVNTGYLKLSEKKVDLHVDKDPELVEKDDINQNEANKESDDSRESDDENRADDSDREDRFVETDKHPEFMQSREFKDLKPYYNGSVLDDRNAEMRKSIYYIRQHWDEYDSFIVALKQLFLSDEPIEFKDPHTNNDFEKLFSKQRNWMTEESVQQEEPTYEAIRLYTSKEGYSRIYRLCNHVFRDEKCLVSVDEIRSVVFLIELINIDLYNYCLRYPEKRDLQGTAYRGMVLDEVDFAQFKTLRDAPISKRNIAVPLGKYCYTNYSLFVLVSCLTFVVSFKTKLNYMFRLSSN